MQPQYQFNLGYDPLLNVPVNSTEYINELDGQIRALQEMKQQIVGKVNNAQISQVQQPQAKQNQQVLWDDINKEVGALTNAQKEILFKDQEYAENDYNIQLLVQQELINLVKLKVQNTEKGKELLEKQLKLIKDKKENIVEESNKEIELFKKFQVAVQVNPNLTYPEFIKSINK